MVGTIIWPHRYVTPFSNGKLVLLTRTRFWHTPKRKLGFQVGRAAEVDFPYPEWGLHRQDAEIIMDEVGSLTHLVKRTGSFMVGFVGRLELLSSGTFHHFFDIYSTNRKLVLCYGQTLSKLRDSERAAEAACKC